MAHYKTTTLAELVLYESGRCGAAVHYLRLLIR
jgi:hypothetical protein